MTLLGKECGVPGAVFRALAGTQTTHGGFYTADFRPRTKTVMRALWNADRSPEVTVQVRAYVSLAKRPPNRFRVAASGTVSFDGTRVAIERFDKNFGWQKVQTVTIKSDTYGRVLGEGPLQDRRSQGHDLEGGAAARAGQAVLSRRLHQAHPNVEETT